jgi:hypothetical protein
MMSREVMERILLTPDVTWEVLQETLAVCPMSL